MSLVDIRYINKIVMLEPKRHIFCHFLQVYYGRDSQRILRLHDDSDSSEGEEANRPKHLTTAKEAAERETRHDMDKKKAFESSNRAADRMIDNGLKKNPLPVHKLGETVRVRYFFPHLHIHTSTFYSFFEN